MKSHMDSRLRPLALIVVVGLALGLAACGGGGGDGNGAAPGVPPVVPLGDPVTATLGPAGGSVAFTASGVAGSLGIPAGALDTDTTITVTPVAPGAEEWARVDVSGIGTVLEQAATLTLTLPAGTALDPAAAVTQRGVEGDVLLPASVDTAARQVSARVQRFSVGARTVEQAGNRNHALAAQPSGRNQALAAPPNDPASTLILNQRLLVRLRVITAEARYQQLVRAGDYSSTLELSMSIAALLQASGLDGYDAAALPWLQRAQTGACENLRGAISRAQSEPAPTTLDLEGRIGNAYVTRLSAPVLYWSSVVDRLGGSCPDLNPSAALNSVHQRLLAVIADKLVQRQDVASLRGAVGEAAAALALKRQADTLAATQIGPRSTDERQHALGATAAPQGRQGRLDAATHPATLGAQIRDEVTTPALAPIRAGMWTGAMASGTSAEYGRPLQIYGAASPLADDVQQIGTTLHVGSYATPSASTALGQASTGRAATPQQSTTTATLDADAAGEIRLSGPIDVLKCPAAANERLVIEFEGTQVLERPSSGDRLLQGTETLLVPDLLRAAGIDPRNATRHSLRVKRVGSSCNAAFGTPDAVLSTLVLDLQPPRLGSVSLGSPRASPLFDLIAGGPRDELYVASGNGVTIAPSLTGTPMRYFARLDAQLRPRWVAEWTGASDNWALVSLAFDSDGHPVVLASETHNTPGTDAVVVASFHKDTGVRRWLHRLRPASAGVNSTESIYPGHGVVATADGQVVFVVQTSGRLGDKTSAETRSVLVRMDAAGAVVWGRVLPLDRNYGVGYVGPGANGGFAHLVPIQRFDSEGRAAGFDVVVRRYDATGSATGSSTLRSLAEPGLPGLRLTTPAFGADGAVLLGSCSGWDAASETDQNCELALFGPQGTPRFRQGLSAIPTRVTLDRSQRAIVSGVDGKGLVSNGDRAWIQAFDANGSSLWSRSLGAVEPWALATDGTVGSLLTGASSNGQLIDIGALLRFRIETGP